MFMSIYTYRVCHVDQSRSSSRHPLTFTLPCIAKTTHGKYTCIYI